MKNKMYLKAKDIIKETKGELLSGNMSDAALSFEIDTRRLKKGQAFIALKGQQSDGHDYLQSAYKKGCRFFVVSQKVSLSKFQSRITVIRVKDTYKALVAIAMLKRKLSKAKIIAVTGSCGKSTTKEMLASILSKKYNVLKNEGNFNNHYGLPLTLSNLKAEHQVAVLEMGMNHPKEIKKLNQLAGADMGIITCVHPVHLEFFKNIKEIAKAKWELVETLKGRKVAIVNADSKELKPLIKMHKGKIITFAINSPADYRANDIIIKDKEIDFKVNGVQKISLNLFGGFNVSNALAAIAAARELNISYEKIREALKQYKLLPMRMQYMNFKGIEIINDGYNANPKSIELALESLKLKKSNGKKIIVLADMLELGGRSRKYHERIGRLVAQSKIDLFIVYGEHAGWYFDGAKKAGMPKKKIFFLKNTQKVTALLLKKVKKDDVVFLKGSRLMKTEEIAECFMNSYIP
jgi:UDP-N-acetylmuramoyl-tripeptide--D-alanyl-D-alanine ligase